MKRTPLTLILLLLVLLAPAARAAAPALESFRGEIAVRDLGTAIVVALDQSGDGFADRLFLAELGHLGTSAVPEGRLGAGQVFAWPGHLLVVGREAGEALSLTLEGAEALPGRSRRTDSLEAALEKGYRVSRLEVGSGLTALQAPLDRLRIDDVVEADATVLRTALSRVGLPAGPAAPAANEPFDLRAALKTIYHPDPPPGDPGPGGGGNPTCGRACSIECGGGSSCSASCSPAGCASCTCPASCSCS